MPHDNSPADWDARYAENERMWSGQPNALLVRETADLTPGRALDVGCGEGADAVWLAEQGWSVTAVDVSQVAVGRGRSAAAERAVSVDFIVDDVATISGEFDLVSAFYPVLRKDSDALNHVLSLVTVGGTLLFVHHLDVDRERAAEHGMNPDDYLAPDDVSAALAERADWEIVRHESFEREVSHGAGAHHRVDGLVRAVRRA